MQRLGTLRDSASISVMVKSTPASWAMASRWRTVLVEPPMAMSRVMAFMKAARLAMDRGSTELSSRSYQRRVISTIRPAARSNMLLAVAMGGQDRAVARQGQAEGLVEAVHRVGGEHAGTGTAGRAGAALDPFDFSVVDILVGGHDHGVDQIVALVAVDAGLHRPAGDEDGRDVEAHRGHQHARGDLVAVADADHRVDRVGVAHVFDAVGDQFARRQRVEHAGVAHGDAVVDGDGIELGGEAALVGDDLFQLLADVMEMHMAGDKLGEGVDDAR